MEKIMKHILGKKLLTAVFTALAASLLSACGIFSSQEERQLGVDGYVYVAEPVSDRGLPETDSQFYLSDFCIAGSYLYYKDNAIRRIPLDDIPDFSKRELIRRSDFLQSFTVDDDLNLYCYTSSKYVYFSQAGAPADITLSKYSPEGELLFQLPFPQESDAELQSGRNGKALAVDNNGNVYMLTESAILKVNKEGQLTGKYSLDPSQVSSDIQKYLLKDSDGAIYYITDNYTNAQQSIFLVTGDAVPVLTPLSGLSVKYELLTLCEGLDGLLIDAPDGSLYQYKLSGLEASSGQNDSGENDSAESDSKKEILCWEDSNLVQDDIDSFVQLKEDLFLVSISIWDEEPQSTQQLLLLRKTSVDEIPQKEMLTLASLFPTESLKRSVVEFNRTNSQYHISIERYGGTNPWQDNEESYTRLDASMSSNNGPDLLDMSYLNIDKYADKDILCDLTPYMEKSSLVKTEDFLDSVRTSYTRNGRLVCLPKHFYMFIVYCPEDLISSREEWTMEHAMALTEQYPDIPLLPYIWNESSFMMENFLAAYYLEKYIDWEKGTCSFDSDSFRRLLEWAGQQLLLTDPAQKSLIRTTYFYDFEDYHGKYYDEGNITLLSLPTAKGDRTNGAIPSEAMAITENSRYKDGAWAFLEYYYTRESSLMDSFPTNKDALNALAQDSITPKYILDNDGNPLKEDDGTIKLDPKWYYIRDNKWIPIYNMEQWEVDAVMNLINSLDFSLAFTPQHPVEDPIVRIVSEEAESYFSNSKTVDEVAQIIQNRVQNLLYENQ